MKTHIPIITLLLGTLLAGCGVKKQDHQKIIEELRQSQQELSNASDEADKMRSDAKEAKAKIAQLLEELDKLKNSDRIAFADAGSISDPTRRQAALRQFIQVYPGSTLVSNAETIIKRIDEDIRQEAMARREEQDRRQRLAEQEREQKELRLRALAQRVQSGNATGQELSEILVGRTQTDVTSLLGRPYTTHINGTVWLYEGVVRDPVSGDRPTLRVWFKGQAVDKLSW